MTASASNHVELLELHNFVFLIRQLEAQGRRSVEVNEQRFLLFQKLLFIEVDLHFQVFAQLFDEVLGFHTQIIVLAVINVTVLGDQI